MGPGVRLTNYISLVPRLRMSGATSLLPLRLHDVCRDNLKVLKTKVIYIQLPAPHL